MWGLRILPLAVVGALVSAHAWAEEAEDLRVKAAVSPWLACVDEAVHSASGKGAGVEDAVYAGMGMCAGFEPAVRSALYDIALEKRAAAGEHLSNDGNTFDRFAAAEREFTRMRTRMFVTTVDGTIAEKIKAGTPKK